MCMFIETDFFDQYNYLWDKKLLKEIKKVIEELKKKESSKVVERNFLEFDFEVKEAMRKFFNDISSLVLISKCRVKGDNVSHFGGQECLAFARSIRSACTKYLSSCDKINIEEGSFEFFISKIKEKAIAGESKALDIEKKTREKYSEIGIDDTLKNVSSWGYDLNWSKNQNSKVNMVNFFE